MEPLSDIEILNETQKEVKIWEVKKGKKSGKYKSMFLYMLPISSYYEEFVPNFVVFLNFFKADNEKIRLPTGKSWSRKKELATLKSQLQRIFSYALVRKLFIRLLQKCGYLKMSRKYFESNATPFDLVEIFLKIYKFNVDDFKKKILDALQKVSEFQELQRTYTGRSLNEVGYNRLQDIAGFQKKLKPRFQRLEK